MSAECSFCLDHARFAGDAEGLQAILGQAKACETAGPDRGDLGECAGAPLDVPADVEYGGIRAELEAAGKPIGLKDLLNAAHAYAVEAVLDRKYGRTHPSSWSARQELDCMERHT